MESRSGRSEEVNTTSAVSLGTSEGEEPLNCYGPMSPTFKVPHTSKACLCNKVSLIESYNHLTFSRNVEFEIYGITCTCGGVGDV